MTCRGTARRAPARDKRGMKMAKKILVVDDEPDILEVIIFRLESKRYHVLKAGDGKEAMDIVRRDRPDLVLLDLRLPIIDGYEVCRLIKSDDELKDIKVILLTASVTTSVTEKINELDADGCIIKPFIAEDFLRKVEEMIGPAEE